MGIITGMIICFSGVAYSYEEVHYSHNGNYKAYIQFPKISGLHTESFSRSRSGYRFPVIVYNYDQFYDWAGKETANNKGYKLENFLDVFSDWGYVVIIPVERYRKLNAIKGAIEYVKTLENVDPNAIHMIGKGEGSFLSILAAADMPVTSLSIIAPNSIDYTGYFSLPNLIRKIEPIRHVPVLYIAATGESKTKIRFQKGLHKLLLDQGVSVKLVQIPQKQKWFWHHTHYYMDHIEAFIQQLQNRHRTQNNQQLPTDLRAGIEKANN